MWAPCGIISIQRNRNLKRTCAYQDISILGESRISLIAFHDGFQFAAWKCPLHSFKIPKISSRSNCPSKPLWAHRLQASVIFRNVHEIEAQDGGRLINMELGGQFDDDLFGVPSCKSTESGQSYKPKQCENEVRVFSCDLHFQFQLAICFYLKLHWEKHYLKLCVSFILECSTAL